MMTKKAQMEMAIEQLTAWIREQPFASEMPAPNANRRSYLTDLRHFVSVQSQAAVQSLPDATVHAIEEALA